MSGPAATVIGKVAIKIVPDTDDFRSEAQRALNRIEKQLDPLEIKFDLAAASKKKVQAQIDLLTRRRTVTIKPELDNRAMATVEGALASLAAFSGGRGLKELGADFGEWVSDLDREVPRIAATTLAITNLGSAALTSGANLVSLGGSLASIVPAALALPGIFGGMAIGLGASIAVLKDFNKRLPEVKDKLAALQDRMSDRFWNIAETPIRNLIDSLLPEFSAGIEKTSSALGKFFANLADSTKGKFGGELGSMFDDLNESIQIAGTNTDVFVDIIRRLGSVGAGNLPRLAGFFNDISTKFDNFLARKGKSGLQDLVDTGIDALKDLGGVIEGTSSLLAGLARAAEASGASTLATLSRTMQSAAKTVNGPKFQNALRNAFAGAREGLDQLTNRSGKQFESLMLRVSDLLSKVLPKAGQAAGTALGAIFGALDQPVVEKSIIGFFDDINRVVNNLAPSLPGVAAGLAGIVRIAGQVATNISGALGVLLSHLGPDVAKLSTDLEPLVKSLGDGLKNAAELAAPVLDALEPTLAGVGSAIQSILRPLNGLIDLLQKVTPSAADSALSHLAAIGILVGGTVWLGAAIRTKILGFANSLVNAGTKAGVAEGAFLRAGVAAENLGTKLSRGFLAKAGGVLAVGTAVGMLADNINRIDSDNLERSLTALQLGNVTDTIDKVTDSLSELTATRNKIDLGEIVTAGGLFGDSSLDKFADNVDQVDQKLAQLVETGQQAQAADIFQKIQDLASAKGVDPSKTAARFDAYTLALQNAASAGSLFDGPLKTIKTALDNAATAADGFSQSLADLNGWFDKRAAVRQYGDSLKTLTKSIKDGFTRKDAENLDSVGRSIVQVADNLKGKARSKFLQDTRQQLEDLASHSGPKAAAALQKLIDKLDSEGLTHPPKIKPDVDDKPANGKVDNLMGKLRRYSQTNATAKVDVSTGNSLNVIQSVLTALSKVRDKTVHVNVVTTNTRGGVTSSGGGHSTEDHTTERQGATDGAAYSKGFAKELEKLLSKISDMYQKAIDKAGKHAKAIKDQFSDTIKRVRELAKEHEKLSRQLDNAQAKLTDLLSQQQALHDSVKETVIGSADITQLGAKTYDGLVRALTRAKNNAVAFKEAIQKLIAAGLNNTTLQQLLAAGPNALGIAQQILQGGVGQINEIQAQIEAAAEGLGSTAGEHFFGDLVAQAQGDVDKLLKQLGPLQEKLRKFAHDLIESLAKALKKEWKDQMGDKGKDDKNPDTTGTKTRQATKAAAKALGGSGPVIGKQINLTYNAAPGKSISSEEELWEALDRAG